MSFRRRKRRIKYISMRRLLKPPRRRWIHRPPGGSFWKFCVYCGNPIYLLVSGYSTDFKGYPCHKKCLPKLRKYYYRYKRVPFPPTAQKIKLVKPRRIQHYAPYTSLAQGIEPPQRVLRKIYKDNDGDIIMIIKTYKWSHDGPFQREDNEPIVYLYEKGNNIPKHAISFSHYGYVYHRNLKPWNHDDFSPKFPNSFHTPILRAEEVEIDDGILSKSAYAAARATYALRKQTLIEPPYKEIRDGLPPNSARIYRSVCSIISNWRRYWNELER